MTTMRSSTSEVSAWFSRKVRSSVCDRTVRSPDPCGSDDDGRPGARPVASAVVAVTAHYPMGLRADLKALGDCGPSVAALCREPNAIAQVHGTILESAMAPSD